MAVEVDRISPVRMMVTALGALLATAVAAVVLHWRLAAAGSSRRTG